MCMPSIFQGFHEEWKTYYMNLRFFLEFLYESEMGWKQPFEWYYKYLNAFVWQHLETYRKW